MIFSHPQLKGILQAVNLSFNPELVDNNGGWTDPTDPVIFTPMAFCDKPDFLRIASISPIWPTGQVATSFRGKVAPEGRPDYIHGFPFSSLYPLIENRQYGFSNIGHYATILIIEALTNPNDNTPMILYLFAGSGPPTDRGPTGRYAVLTLPPGEKVTIVTRPWVSTQQQFVRPNVYAVSPGPDVFTETVTFISEAGADRYLPTNWSTGGHSLFVAQQGSVSATIQWQLLAPWCIQGPALTAACYAQDHSLWVTIMNHLVQTRLKAHYQNNPIIG